MIWKILILSRLQRMIKLGDLLSGKCTLQIDQESGLMTYGYCLTSSERSECSQKGCFEVIKCVTHRFPSHLSRSKTQIYTYIGKPLFSKAILHDIHGRSTHLESLYQQKQKCPCLIPEICNLFLYVVRDFENVIKDLEMKKLYWIIWVVSIKLYASLKSENLSCCGERDTYP